MHYRKSKLSRSIYRMRAGLVAVLAAGVSLTWAPWAQAAGTVQVSVKNGNLEIRGDDASNCIEITGKGGTGEYAIGGCGSTLINGGAISGVIHDIIIDMRGGDDQVTIDDGDNNIAQDDLKITTGSGNDTVTLRTFRVVDDLTISTGPGDDKVILDSSIGVSGNVNIDTGPGTDVVCVPGPFSEGPCP